MARDFAGISNYPNECTLTTADTPQLLTSGAESNTFAVSVRYIQVQYCDEACYIAKTAAALTPEADGSADGRVYVPAGASGLALPWSGQDVFFVDASGSDTPFIAVVGIA